MFVKVYSDMKEFQANSMNFTMLDCPAMPRKSEVFEINKFGWVREVGYVVQDDNYVQPKILVL